MVRDLPTASGGHAAAHPPARHRQSFAQTWPFGATPLTRRFGEAGETSETKRVVVRLPCSTRAAPAGALARPLRSTSSVYLSSFVEHLPVAIVCSRSFRAMVVG